jgi:hypothetical protein
VNTQHAYTHTQSDARYCAPRDTGSVMLDAMTRNHLRARCSCDGDAATRQVDRTILFIQVFCIRSVNFKTLIYELFFVKIIRLT